MQTSVAAIGGAFVSYGQYSTTPRPGKPTISVTQSGKRKRHVFPTSEIPHLWAHKTQAEAWNAQRNLYFENETIYSYGSHFPIARHVTNKRGRNAVLVNSGRHSVTTSRHQSAVGCAIPSDVQRFEVPNLNAGDTAFDRNIHVPNVAYYQKQVAELMAAYARARDAFNKDWKLDRAKRMRAEAIAYAKFFGLKTPKLQSVSLASVPALQKKLKIEAAASAAETRAEKKRARIHSWAVIQLYREARHELNWNDEELLKTLPESEQAQIKAEHDAAVLIRSAEAVEQWRAGKRPDHSLPYDLPVMLRVVTGTDGPQVETSRGARVPAGHALRGLRFVRAVVARGEAYQRNGHTLHLGHYAIDRIDTDGTLKAGCHVISYAEIERLAPVLESLTVPESENTQPSDVA